MISRTSEHALRAVLYLARQPGPVSADRVAEALAAPRNYLSKTLHTLAKSGIVRGKPGPRGGFRLALPPEQLALARVVGLFEEPSGEPMCMLRGKRCDGTDPCPAHRRWTALMDASQAPLKEATVADLL